MFVQPLFNLEFNGLATTEMMNTRLEKPLRNEQQSSIHNS